MDGASTAPTPDQDRSSAPVRITPLTDLPRAPDGRIDVDGLAAALAPVDVLETATGAAGWSYLVPTIGARIVDDGHRTVLDHGGGRRTDLGADPFAAIEGWCSRAGVTPDAPRDPRLPPFTGGLVGAFAYDLGRRIERLPTLAVDDRQQAHLSLRIAEVVVAVSPTRSSATVLGRPLVNDRAVVRRLMAEVTRRCAAATRAPAVPAPDRRSVTTSLPRDEYLAAVRSVLEHIAAGDCFQVNLAQRLTTTWTGTLSDLYRRLRAASPAPHAAMLADVGVASISPETFLEVDGHDVTVRPIKGTRPRHADPTIDAANADDLATSAKDRAENVMIVDLERNDLGRVCVPGSVSVPQLCVIEPHPTVWHLVSEVIGELRPGTGYGELLRATFPCGSITGAPKVRAMEVIEALEPVRRGWYCGALGFLSPGAASLSVAIRTATRHPDGTVDHGAGGGIVAASDPALEHEESLAKAAAFLSAVAGELR
ncbi:MAG: aminodeoxychorismate synthase component I [Nitriliruptor sp.]|uniref:aminodeoxychorismate synthase component I n=1 Tax=Nitriliruptor sp. TaxID=2448056 RepID=UPI0034A06B88